MANTAYTPLVQGETKQTIFRFHRNVGARNLCILALIVSFLIGAVLTGFGVYIVHFLGPTYHLHYWEYYFRLYSFTNLYIAPRALEGIKLLLNIRESPGSSLSRVSDIAGLHANLSAVITFLIESLGYIHTASLRWTLLRQGRLSFNSNLRLWSSTSGFSPNAWYMNLMFTTATVLAYASASLLFAMLPDTYFESWTLSLCVVAAIFLGVSILVMVLIATWSLFATRIPTWSSSPLHTVLAAKAEGHLEPQPNRCMLGVQDIQKKSEPVYPKKKQIGALASRRAAACVVLILAILDVGLYVVSAVLLSKWLNETTYLPGDGYIPIDQSWDGTPMTMVIPDSLRSVHIYITILLYGALLWPITLCMHSLELVVNLSRDEQCWRQATSPKGCTLKDYDSILAAFTNWRSVVLFAFKSIIHWLFGITAVAYQPVSDDASISNAPTVLLSWRPWQSIVLAGVVNLCIVVFLYAGRYQPKGPQPAAYGHLQTLANLVDDWSPGSPKLYWGHKRDGFPCHAGTSDTRLLEPIRMDAQYA